MSEVPSTARSERSDSIMDEAELMRRGDGGKSKVATKLREAVNDWGIKDPALMRTFAKRQQKARKMQNAATKRKNAKDPEERLKRFHKGKSAAGSAAGSVSSTPRGESAAWEAALEVDDDAALSHQHPDDRDDMSVHSFQSEAEQSSRGEIEFSTAAPNMKLSRSLRSGGDGRASAASEKVPGRPRKSAPVRTQHLVMNNNYF